MQIVTHVPPSMHMPPSPHGVAPDGSVTHALPTVHLPVTRHAVLGQTDKKMSPMSIGLLIGVGILAVVGTYFVFTKLDFWPED